MILLKKTLDYVEREVDQVILLDDGRVAKAGKYSDIWEDRDFVHFMAEVDLMRMDTI